MSAALLLAGCISPPNRDLKRDEEMKESNELLEPVVRGPVDAENAVEGDPDRPALKNDVRRLASEIPLQRIQANNRLKQAGTEGILAANEFIQRATALDARPRNVTVEQIVEAIRFIASCQLDQLEAEQLSLVRSTLAGALGHEESRVRVQAAWALQVHGPGAQRTAFLTAIGDEETRVRWAVVRRFGDNPRELDKAQRSILLTFLDSGTRDDFETHDKDKDGYLDRRQEYPPTATDFDKLDRDEDGRVSLDEWVSPVSAQVRADVFALLLRLHGELTPDIEPAGYNPWIPSADQLDRVRLWREWNDEVSKGKEQPEDEG